MKSSKMQIIAACQVKAAGEATWDDSGSLSSTLKLTAEHLLLGQFTHSVCGSTRYRAGFGQTRKHLPNLDACTAGPTQNVAAGCIGYFATAWSLPAHLKRLGILQRQTNGPCLVTVHLVTTGSY